MSDKTLSQIFIYPIKSLGGIPLTSTELTGKGPKWDRRWMLVDQNGRFLSQRELGKMALLQPFLEADHLRIEDRKGGHSPLEIPLTIDSGQERLQVEVWKDQCDAVLVSEAANKWFSKALDFDCRLVYMPDNSFRPIDPRYAEGQEAVSFADGYPYLIIGEHSMSDLNKRLETPIEIERFRPNFVFAGGTAFEEDQWGHFSIGTAHFRGTKPCARCQIPSIDPDTGIAGQEPARTMAGFRRFDRKILFGLNVCWETTSANSVQLGDRISLAT